MQSRRSFLQTAAAAFAGVALGRLGSPSAPGPRPIDYTRFVEREAYDGARYQLAAPFSHGDMICATDCRILLTHQGELSGDGSARVPDVSRLNWSEFDSRGWRELPRVGRVARFTDVSSRCVHCLGTGFLGESSECGECYGAGDVPTKLGDYVVNFWDCPRCNGRGKLGTTCVPCGGTGYTLTAEQLYGERFCVFYLDALRRLGPIETRLIQGAKSSHGESAALIFRGEHGVRGFLMPFCRPGESR